MSYSKKKVPPPIGSPPTVSPPTVPPPIGSPPEYKQQKENEELKKQIEELKSKNQEIEQNKNKEIEDLKKNATTIAPTNNRTNPENTNNQPITDIFKSSIIGFLDRLKKETFFINDEITQNVNQMINKAITEINTGNIDSIKKALKDLRNIVIENKINIPDNYKEKSKKYIDALEKLDFDNLSNQLNLNTIFALATDVVTDVAKNVVGFIPQNNNPPNINTTPSKENKMDGITNATIGRYYDAKTGVQQGINSLVGMGQQLSGNLRDGTKTKETGQAMEGLRSVGNMLGKSETGLPQGLPQGLPGMPGMPGMPGASGALSSLVERFIIKKIDETFLKIQEQICATFSNYKKQIGKALIKKMVEKIEEHSTAFKEYTKFRYDYEANKSKGKSALNTSNVFFQIYDNVRAQIQYKQVDFKKMDFSDQIFSKYEAWKTEYDKKKNNSLISGGEGVSDVLNAAQAMYDAIPLPKDAEVKIKEGITRIMGTELIDNKSDSKQNDGDDKNGKNGKDGKNGDDEDDEDGDKDGDKDGKDGKNGKKKSKNGKINNLDEAVIQSIEKLNIPFTNAQMDLIYEKVFFGLHNPSVLIVKLLCNIDDEEREQLIKDLTIQNTRDKMKEYYNEYMANKPGWPQRTKTIWEKIACNMNRHTDCPEDFKVPPILEPLTGVSAVPGAVPDNAVTGAAVPDNTGAAVPGAVTNKGGYEKYINNPRKTKRKRLVKKGKRKNKSYHRRGSV